MGGGKKLMGTKSRRRQKSRWRQKVGAAKLRRRAVGYDDFFAYGLQKQFEIGRGKHHRCRVVAGVELDCLRIPRITVDDERRVVPVNFVEKSKGTYAATMHAKMLGKLVFRGELELGAPDVRGKVAHVGTLSVRQNYHVKVRGFFVLDVKIFACHAVGHVDDLGGLLRGDDSLVAKQFVSDAQRI